MIPKKPELIELIFAEDGTLLQKDTKQRVDAIPVGKPDCIGRHKYSYLSEGEIKQGINEDVISRGISLGANAYVREGKDLWEIDLRIEKYYWLPIQFYRAYDPSSFIELYRGIAARIEQHPEVELRGQSVNHGHFADVNIDMYVTPYRLIREASKLNEILQVITPEGTEPTQRMDAFVPEGFPVLNFGVLGFKAEIGEKRTLESYTGMASEELLKKIGESSIITKGVYAAGIRLHIFPHKKFVFQNQNGVWVSEKYSCGFYELDELEKMD